MEYFITYFALFSSCITGSDFHNGIVGFSHDSLTGQVLDEDSENKTIQLFVQRQPNR